MGTQSSFNLERSIQSWLAPFRSSGAFTTDNLNELSDHVMDAYENYSDKEISEESRFNRVVEQVGRRRDLITSYAQNNQPIIVREYLLYFLMGPLGFLGIYMAMVILFDILAIIPFYSGIRGSYLNSLMMGNLIGVFGLFSYFFWRYFLQLNKSIKGTIDWFHWVIRKPLIIILGFIILIYLFHFPLNRIVRFGVGTQAESLWQNSSFTRVIPYIFYGIPIWWILMTGCWASWMYRKSASLSIASFIKHNRVLSFAFGGLITVLYFIIIHQAQLGFFTLFIRLELEVFWGNLILNTLIILITILPIIIYILFTSFPRFFTPRLIKVPYRSLIVLAVCFLVLYGVDLYSVKFIDAHVKSRLSFYSYQLVPVFIYFFVLVFLLFAPLDYFRLFRKGRLIECGA